MGNALDKMDIHCSNKSNNKNKAKPKEFKKKLLQLHNNLIICSFETTFKVWEPSNLCTPKTFSNQNSIVKSIIQLRDNTITTGLNDGLIRLWTYDSIQIVSSLIGHNKAVLCLSESNYNDYVFSGSADCSVKIWDIQKKQCLTTLNGHKESITCLLELYDSRLSIGSLDRTIAIWNAKFNKHSIMNNVNARIYSIVQLTDENIAYRSDKGIQLFNIKKMKHIKTLKHSYPGKIPLIKLNNKVIICSSKEIIYVIDVLNDQCLCKYKDPYQNFICSMILLSNNRLAYMTLNPEINILNVIKNSGLTIN